jgi:hypothetical protein
MKQQREAVRAIIGSGTARDGDVRDKNKEQTILLAI